MITVKRILALGLLLVPVLATAAGGGARIESANIDISNQASLQRGARYFVNYCMGCHSAKYVRYNRLAADLGLTEDQVIANLMFTGERPSDTMDIAMPAGDAATWFGRTPPDLSLTARARGADWIYSFLKSFYLSPDRVTGVDNLVLEGASMPAVLWDLQGTQKAVFHEETDAQGHTRKIFEGFETVTPGAMSEQEFETMLVDLVAFLSYISEPVQLERKSLGVKVILFLVVFFLFAFLLKKEIWKDVH
jgi:ubiquinol-cytochrome c reductase cytochrome c1 subunit